MTHIQKFPPKGYLGNEYPLMHDMEFQFSLNAEDETKNSTLVPIMFQDSLAQTLATTYVNPKSASFEVSAQPNCSPESIVPQLQLSFKCSLTKGAIETDKIRSLSLNYMFINGAFLNRLDATDDKTGFDIETILELTHETDEEQVIPLWANVKLSDGSLVPTGVEGLTTTQVYESVAFDKELFFDAMQYYTNNHMLRTMAPSMKTILLKRDYPYTRSGTKPVAPICKFQNPYSFGFLLFHLPQVGSIDQYGLASETTNIPHVTVSGKIRFPEWNKGFFQESTGT